MVVSEVDVCVAVLVEAVVDERVIEVNVSVVVVLVLVVKV